MSAAPPTARPLSVPLPCTGGAATWLQALPSQCASSGAPARPGLVPPAAQISFAATAVTAVRLLVDGSAGAGTCVQTAPSQCRIRAPPAASLLYHPTAQTSFRSEERREGKA